MNENFPQSAARAAIIFGAVAGAALLARRTRPPAAHGDAGELAPLAVDELGPIRIDPRSLDIPGVYVPPADAPSPASVLERVTKPLLDLVRGVMSPRGIRNNNPGNIRWLEQPGRRWRGMVKDDGNGYAIFDTMANGVRALGKQLLKYQERGLRSVRTIIGTWAPPSENLTSSYVTAVARELEVGPDDELDVGRRLAAFGRAIVKHENGGDFTSYSDPRTGHRFTAEEFALWIRLP